MTEIVGVWSHLSPSNPGVECLKSLISLTWVHQDGVEAIQPPTNSVGEEEKLREKVSSASSHGMATIELVESNETR